ncbi:ABC transporter ATP-binding protein [Schinkia azotoformans]|uniref:ABC transporter ATP-binding protein n=1 Tax=Schinkia azotoformans TaxID=1454 RepID=UPI002DB97D0B|nr:ABC transporter ATP-binding protein [Schinkia azotoformans]MEC1721471.1 ABC transporter ATP-binding protein [Schinkia azotoformans]MED4415736.1 ABC transporter ATP-binding protein [Schinkia azotoformans]
MSTLLQLKNVNSFYGEAHILHNLSLEINSGEVVSLLGRNGVGKTTTLKTIMGMVKVDGDVIFNEGNISGVPANIIAKKGIGYVPEERRIFPSLTVKENLLVGVYQKGEWGLREIYELFPVLEKRQNSMGTMLSGGEQQMLAIARCLMTNPKLILLDEPCEGLAPVIVQELERAIAKLKDKHVTILLAEQSLRLSKTLANRHYILSKGEVCFEGNSNELFSDEAVLVKYLGVS